MKAAEEGTDNDEQSIEDIVNEVLQKYPLLKVMNTFKAVCVLCVWCVLCVCVCVCVEEFEANSS